MSQFKKTGAYYCSTFGGSGANPGTATAPYAHPSSAPNSAVNIVVCSGYFKGGWTGSRRLLGDGPCVVDLQGANVNLSSLSESLWLKNGSIGTIAGVSQRRLNDCILDEIEYAEVSHLGLYNSIVLPNTFNLVKFYGQFVGYASHTIFLENVEFSGQNSQTNTFQYNYLDKDKYIYLNLSVGLGSMFYRSIINGRVIYGGTTYEAKKLKDGSTRPDANPAYSDIIGLQANFYTNGCYAGDMKFIDVIRRKVYPDSDIFYNVSFQNSNGFIGGCTTGRYIQPDSTDFEYDFSTDIDDTDPLSLVTASGQPYGKIRITGKISDNLITAPNIDFSSILKFDATVAGGVAANNNVLDAARDMGLTLSNFKPRRFTFKIRTSADPTANQASASSVWDNDGKATAGDWFLCEFNKPVNLHLKSGVNYGNADYRGFVPESVVNFQFRSIDIEVILDQEWDIV